MKTKYTVITGASSGIGRAVALKFIKILFWLHEERIY